MSAIRPARARGGAVVRAGMLALIVAGVAVAARAELPAAGKLRKLVEQRTEIVRASLQLDAAQQAAFEPVYQEYEVERAALGGERYGIAEDFTKSSLGMTPEAATALLERSFKLRRQRVELDERFRPRFEAVLPAPKVLLLYQLNFILDAVVSYDLAGMIPLAH